MALRHYGQFIFLSMCVFRIVGGISAQREHTAASSSASVPRVTCVPEGKNLAGQACLAQFTIIPVNNYQALLAHIPKTEKQGAKSGSGSDTPWLSRVQASPIPSIKASSLLISTSGMPADEYMDRAKIVYDDRVPAWNLAIGVGGRCSVNSAMCSSNLHCVGPESQEQCHPAQKAGWPCDFEYRLCESNLVCKKGTCLTHEQAFRGERGDTCGGSSGIICEPGLRCNSWESSKVGTCEDDLNRGEDCKLGSGRKCKYGLQCIWHDSTKTTKKCLKQNLPEGDLCRNTVECLAGLQCRIRVDRKKCTLGAE